LLLRRLLTDSSQIRDFDDLPIPFRAVATNLATMQPMVFDSGDLATAVRASMSVPGAFEPVRRDGMVFVDGGIVDNVPVDVARSMGADVVIAVDVRTPLIAASELTSMAAILNQVINGLISAALKAVSRGRTARVASATSSMRLISKMTVPTCKLS